MSWDEALAWARNVREDVEARARQDMLSKCGCGRLQWASAEKCPACMRGPLPSDAELRWAFDRAPKGDGEHVRRLDPRTVRATPPRLIDKTRPRTSDSR